MKTERIVFLALAILFFSILIIRHSEFRSSNYKDKPYAIEYYSAESLVALAATNEDDRLAKIHLQVLIDRYGLERTNAAVRSFDNSWTQRRLFILLSEMVPSREWKETFIRNSTSPRTTPVGDFGDPF